MIRDAIRAAIASPGEFLRALAALLLMYAAILAILFAGSGAVQ